jgi:glycosyltransferase involved in cell wall biosynthesis
MAAGGGGRARKVLAEPAAVAMRSGADDTIPARPLHPPEPTMKITFVCPPLNLTGGIRVVAIYAKYLQTFGHEVHVVSVPHRSKGIVSRILRKLGLPQFAARPQPPSHLDGQGVPQTILGTHRKIRERDVPDADVIIATWWETVEFVRPMARRKGRKVYFVQHHEVFDWLPRERVAATYRSDLQKIAVAQWLVQAIADDGNAQGCTVVPNAVDRAQFHAPIRGKNTRPRIGTLFSETDFKGFDISLAVIGVVRQALPEVEVVAFSERPPVKFRDRMAGIELVLEPRQDGLKDIYASCDVWLCCSKSEGFNLIAMEAMACRTPVVSTRTGWPLEAIVDGVNGALADVDDVAGLAAAVLAILRKDEHEWAALSQGAFETVRDSSWERSARMFEAALIRNETLAVD